MILRTRFAGMIGNILGHYDTALFGLLAPFIAPLFFEKTDPLTALILTYGMMPLGIITRPLGSLFFGWMGDRLGRKQALFCSLSGMAIVTCLMGSLPIYRHAGILAPCLLAAGRMLQSFFAAGESAGASIFILENTPVALRCLTSSFYDLSSISGALIASGLVTFFCMQGWMEEGWRLLFWMGGMTAVVGLFVRLKTQEGKEFQPEKKWGFIHALKGHKRALISVAIASGFSYTTYDLAFTVMNSYVPLVSALTKTDLMKVNTALLVFDMFLLPCFGYLAHKAGKEKVMMAGAFCSALGAIPLFYCLNGAGIAVATAVRTAIVIFGVAFAAPYHAWKLECVPPQYRYTILSLGCTLGSQLIGAPTTAVSLWLYKQLGFVWAPGLYLAVIGVLAWVVVYRQAREEASEVIS
ncbi:MAG: MFS transporter [Chlamydiales bacterium]